MTASNYANCYKITRQWEGGNVDHPKDPGGRTSRGVIQRVYDEYRNEKGLYRQDVFKASEDEIAEIYRIRYWNAVAGDQWPEGADLAVWDCGVNSGPGRSKQFAESLLGKSTLWGVLAKTCAADPKGIPDFVKRFCAKRLSFVQGLKTFSTFGRGWTRRIASIEANGVRMALAALKVSPADQKKQLEKEAGKATSKAKNSAGGAVATGGGGAATSTQVDNPWLSQDWLTFGLKIAAAAAVVIGVIYFIHRWRANKARAEAYAAVASMTGG